MARQYSSEYAARNARAQERGFSSYRAERQFKEANKSELRAAKELLDIGANESYNPKEDLAWYKGYGRLENGTVDFDDPIERGMWQHDLIAYLVEFKGKTEAEAVAIAYDLAAG